MKTIQNPWIKLKERIDHEDYELINKLQEQCIHEDQIALKLELDHKMGVASGISKASSIQNINEFMYFDGQKLIGYVGIGSFGGAGSAIEVNGMVHTEYRRQGVFSTLYGLVLAEWKRRAVGSMLLLSDKRASAGQQFIKGTDAQHEHSEYEMYLKNDNALSEIQSHGITFRKASNADAKELARQNAIYFNDIFEEGVEFEKGLVMPEEEEKRGMTIYIAEKDEKIIGKINLQLTAELGAIYGLGVLPEYRGKGFGRAVLLMGIKKLKEANAKDIMLQVVTENSNALNLYKSCGFVETSVMDYYEIKA